jgi:hypothetical protein
MKRGSGSVISALIVTISACAHGHGAATGQPQTEPLPVSVNVTNNSQSAMEIFAIGSGTSYRLGVVAPGIARRFELRLSMVGSGGRVQFLAQASGAGPRIQSDEILLSPGDVVDFEITTNLIGSRATVRP